RPTLAKAYTPSASARMTATTASVRVRVLWVEEPETGKRVCSFPAPPGAGHSSELPFDQANVSGAWALRRILDGKIHPLPFAQQFEDGASYSTAMEEVFDPALIADETKPLVDEET